MITLSIHFIPKLSFYQLVKTIQTWLGVQPQCRKVTQKHNFKQLLFLLLLTIVYNDLYLCLNHRCVVKTIVVNSIRSTFQIVLRYLTQNWTNGQDSNNQHVEEYYALNA